ncbi:MAG: hypothetical protein SVS15_03845 [Thermodesulfobacteriota bacterium]|nr:hypothetical protein [Thermodesulfobacteriota bacterium]
MINVVPLPISDSKLTLPRALSPLAGGEKRVKNFSPDLLRDARPGVLDAKLGEFFIMTGAYGDGSFFFIAFPDPLFDRQGRVNNI